MKARSIAGLVALGTLFAGLARADDEPPRLVVLVAVDSLAPFQIDRVGDLFVGGLARLLAEGARFSSCHHDHAATYTGPGHFVLSSGRHPGPAGMVGNWWYDAAAERWVYCVEDQTSSIAGRANDEKDRARASSYRNVDASALGDWLKAAHPRGKVFSISRKDRAAVLLGGRAADGAYWYDGKTGSFITSTFYTDQPHGWVSDYNAKRRADDFRGARWERLLADLDVYAARARVDSFPGEEDISASGPDDAGAPVFDHYVAGGGHVDDETFYDALESFPFADVMTMELAMEAIDVEELGIDEHPDLLCIGLSVLDGVAHQTGPFSQESMDVLLRVDRLLGELFERLDELVGPHYVVALSSDHGMLPLPEYVATGGADVGRPARRLITEARSFRDRVLSETSQLAGGNRIVTISSMGVWVHGKAARSHGVDPRLVGATVRSLAAGEDWIDRVLPRADVLSSRFDGDEAEEELVRRFRHATHPSRSPDFLVCAVPGVLYDETGTTHGTPYDYDAHVPLMLWGAGVVAGTFNDDVATVDLAPTLAQLLLLERVPPVDGRVLVEALEPSRRP